MASQAVQEIFDALDEDGFRTVWALENGWYRTEIPEGTAARMYPAVHARHAAEARRTAAAFLLADDLDVLRALLKNERVPADRLHRSYLAQHRRRVA